MAATAPATKARKQINFLSKFRNEETREFVDLTATQFLEIWNHYDQDNNGYIEGKELDEFLREFLISLTPTADGGPEANFSEGILSEIKRDFMEAFDTDMDNRINITELAQILPTEANFLLLFQREVPLESSVEFMKVWKKYDKDHSGFIEADELKAFLSDLLVKSKAGTSVSDDKLLEYTDTIMQLFDCNRDGKLNFCELSRLLPVKENYLCRPMFRNADRITAADLDQVFSHYDRDRNGYIENCELDGFLKDLISLIQEDHDDQDLQNFKKIIMDYWDVNHDNRISRDELRMILLQQGLAAGSKNSARE